MGRCVVLPVVFDFEYEASIHYQIFALLTENVATATDYDLCEGDLSNLHFPHSCSASLALSWPSFPAFFLPSFGVFLLYHHSLVR